jgi:hypothetical protein
LESAIIAAIVAGVVSLIGCMVNLKIAREQRKGLEDQVRLAAAMKYAEEKVKLIKKYCMEAERLRVRCWELIPCVRTAISKGEITSVGEPFERFQDQFRNFLISWAEVKGDIPEAPLRYIRFLRHECKNHGESIEHDLIELFNQVEMEGCQKMKIKPVLEDILKELDLMLRALDNVFSVINVIRDDTINDFLLKGGA